jgi:hypothetical protein
MTTMAIVAGAKVWIVILVCGVLWLAAVLLSRGALLGPRAIAHWLLGAWLPRIVVLSFWGAAGWHIFCQRP